MATSTRSSNDILAAALYYANKLSWPVLPCHHIVAQNGQCSCVNKSKKPCANKPGKHPRTKHGLKDASCDEAQIRMWLNMYPQANLAIATGQVSNTMVLDVDPRHNGDHSLRAYTDEHGPLPETPTQRTGGGGWHHVFAMPPGVDIRNSSDKLGAGLDVRANGGYIIVAPSGHESGGEYVWQEDAKPGALPLANAPQWLLDILTPVSVNGSEPRPDLPPVPLAPLVNGCAWLRHCRDDAAALSEPTWYSMLGIVGRTIDGSDTVHAWSDSYPGYSKRATNTKLKHALDSAGPRTCVDIREHLDGEAYCSECANWGKVVSPISLGRGADKSRSGYSFATSDGQPGVNGTHAQFQPVNLSLGTPASDTWLDRYVEWAMPWAPQSPRSYHEAVGLWLLSTVVARRLKVNFGPGGAYPALYLALVGESSVYTKSTCATIGLTVLRQTHLGMLATTDTATPEAFLQGLTLRLPEDYGDLDPTQQADVDRRLAFAGQKGWFYEEYGGHLSAAVRPESNMHKFHGLLRQMWDCPPEVAYNTISRGANRVLSPYLALLANITPADLQPHVGLDSHLWQDGYLARFALVLPDEGRKNARFPKGEPRVDDDIGEPLIQLHETLGSATVQATEPEGKNRKWGVAWTRDLPEKAMAMPDDVTDAFYAYRDALHDQFDTIASAFHASYTRLPGMALRIATLLDGVALTDGLSMAAFARAVNVTEGWRRSLHKIPAIAHMAEKPTREAVLEDKICALLGRKGEVTPGFLYQHLRRQASVGELHKLCTGLVEAGVLTRIDTSRGAKYKLAVDVPEAAEGGN